MPGTVAAASVTPGAVMPYGLCVAFTESREYVQLQAAYHDSTIERSQLAQTSRRSFQLSQLKLAAALATLRTFWETHNGPLTPFYFYNLIEGPYDPTGVATTGRYAVRFSGSGNWSESTGLLRTSVPSIELEEVV